MIDLHHRATSKHRFKLHFDRPSLALYNRTVRASFRRPLCSQDFDQYTTGMFNPCVKVHLLGERFVHA